MLLVDSLYINNSGGLVLLKYLVKKLQENKLNFLILIDERCSGEFNSIINKRIVKASLWNRYLFYAIHGKDFTKVFCFGNIPPPIKLKVPIYTYYHNINLLIIPHNLNLYNSLLSNLKRLLFLIYKKNTNYWIVQTSNTKKALIEALNEFDSRVLILPFYDIPTIDNCIDNCKTDYLYVSNYTQQKNHILLIESWIKLAELGVFPILHLTLKNYPLTLQKKIELAQSKGAKINNHGTINKTQLFNLYRKCKATVYTSVNESFGLGLIEALSLGCDVIGPNLPYIHSVCCPSETFNIESVDSLVNSILKYENGNSIKSKLIVHNEINSLIQLIS